MSEHFPSALTSLVSGRIALNQPMPFSVASMSAATCPTAAMTPPTGQNTPVSSRTSSHSSTAGRAATPDKNELLVADPFSSDILSAAQLPETSDGTLMERPFTETATSTEHQTRTESSDGECSPLSRSPDTPPRSADVSTIAITTAPPDVSSRPLASSSPFVRRGPGLSPPALPFYPTTGGEEWRPLLAYGSRRPLPRLPVTQPTLSRDVSPKGTGHAHSVSIGGTAALLLPALSPSGASPSADLGNCQDILSPSWKSSAIAGALEATNSFLDEFGINRAIASSPIAAPPLFMASSEPPFSANVTGDGSSIAVDLLDAGWLTGSDGFPTVEAANNAASLLEAAVNAATAATAATNPTAADLTEPLQGPTTSPIVSSLTVGYRGSGGTPRGGFSDPSTCSSSCATNGCNPMAAPDHAADTPLIPVSATGAATATIGAPVDVYRLVQEALAGSAWQSLDAQLVTTEDFNRASSVLCQIIAEEGATKGLPGLLPLLQESQQPSINSAGSGPLCSTSLGSDLPHQRQTPATNVALQILLTPSPVIAPTEALQQQSQQAPKPDDTLAELLKLLQSSPELTSKLATAMQIMAATQAAEQASPPTPVMSGGMPDCDTGCGSTVFIGGPSDSLLGTPRLTGRDIQGPHTDCGPMWDTSPTHRNAGARTSSPSSTGGGTLQRPTSQRTASTSGLPGAGSPPLGIRLPPEAISHLDTVESIHMDGSQTTPDFMTRQGSFYTAGSRFGGAGSSGSLTPIKHKMPSASLGPRAHNGPAAGTDRFFMGPQTAHRYTPSHPGGYSGFGNSSQYGPFHHRGDTPNHEGGIRRDRFPSVDGLPARSAPNQDAVLCDDYKMDDPVAMNKSRLLTEFRLGHIKLQNLYQLENHLVEFACDQMGARFIQQRLASCAPQEVWAARSQLVPHTKMLVTDVFGNHVIQRLLELGSPAQRHQVFLELESDALRFALHTYGCRVLQKALETLNLEDRYALASGLRNHVMRCVEDQNGNHVIQKVLERLPPEYSYFVLEAFRGQVARVSMHCYGCRVIQRALEHCPHERTGPVLDEIMQHCARLAQDQYGNYVMQHVLRYGRESEKAQIVDWIAGDLLALSSHKFSSNVIEKCLEFCSTPEARRKLIGAMFGGPNNLRPPIMQMVRDRYANYVVQRMLDVVSHEESDAVVSEIITKLEKHMPALRKFTYGKHIAATLERLRKQNDEHLRGTSNGGDRSGRYMGHNRNSNRSGSNRGSMSPIIRQRQPPPTAMFDPASPATTASTPPSRDFRSAGVKCGGYCFADSPRPMVHQVGSLTMSGRIAGTTSASRGRFGLTR